MLKTIATGIGGGGNGTVTSVNVSGGTTGLTTSGGPVTTSGTITIAGTLATANGGTGATTYTDGQLLIGNSASGSLTKSTLTAGSGITITNGAGSITITATSGGGGTVTSVNASGGTTGMTFSGGPITGSGTLTLAGTLAIANGGTGQTTQQTALNALAGATTNTYYLRGNGTNVSMSAIQAGDVPTLNQNTTGSAGSVANAATFNNSGTGGASGSTFNGSSALTVSYNTIGASPTAGSTSLITLGNVTTGTWSANAVGVAYGGTGQTTYTDGQLLIGNSTGNTLTKSTLTAGSGITITNGGGSITIASTAGGGTVTSVGQTFTGGLISVSGSPVTTSGTLALTVAGTSGGIPYFSTASTWASSAALAANSLMIGGGAGAAPSTITTGTGVVTALGVNTGSAGAFVVNGGALGTPSSGTLTNATGLPVSSGISGFGTGVATALAVNTGTAGAFVVNGGALGTPSSGTLTNATGLPLSTGVTGTLPVGNGGTGATTLTGVLKGNGTSAFTAATAGTDYVAPGTATTFTASQTFNGSSSVTAAIFANAAETTTISATAATGTINYDITTQSVIYYTSNASANWTVNFRGSSGTSLNTLMSTGQSITVAFLVTQGATAYYNSAVQVDGASVTPKYQGGTAWTAGNASGIDAYVYTIVKTGSAAFTVFASQTQFK